MAMQFELQPNPTPKSDAQRAAELAKPGFGIYFTDHMAVATWTIDEGWRESAVVPYGPFQLDPSTAVLHYGQEIFEGLKAYQWADGSIRLFRPDLNAKRLQRSANRLALPELSTEDFLTSIAGLVQADRSWVPTGGEASLYLRPFMFSSEAFLGVRAARRVTYCCIASPVGSYFAHGVKPVSIWVSQEYSRSARGGTGQAKCGGNYAASLAAQNEAAQNDCEQVLFVDAAEGRWVEELGGMNVFVVRGGELITPELGTILEGVTRSTILTLAGDAGLQPVERKLELAELLREIAGGTVSEVFACGTAAVVTPIGSLATPESRTVIGDGEAGPVTLAIRQQLLDLQYGRAEDTYGWMHTIA